jgi:hypothetical protein
LSRPHEDRERHTSVDHRPGGLPTSFTVGEWIAVGLARVKADRKDACVAAYETLVEQARTSNVHAGPAVVLSSDKGTRVLVMVGVRGHDGFRHLSAAWDDHHRFEHHRVISESVSFALYNVAAAVGESAIDPATHDAFEFERVERPVSHVAELFASAGASPEFRGATLLVGDAPDATIIISRFAHIAAYGAFRSSRAATNALGSVAESGDASFAAHARKTFALAGA